jgi:hypothetical protein
MSSSSTEIHGLRNMVAKLKELDGWEEGINLNPLIILHTYRSTRNFITFHLNSMLHLLPLPQAIEGMA